MKPFIGILSGVMLGAVVGWAIATAMLLYRDPDLSIWPAVTRCRICEHRIWVWQNYEERSFSIKLNNPDHLMMSVGMGGLVHKNCTGTPDAGEVTIKRGNKP